MRFGSFELAANVSMLFTELPYLDRFAAARAAGFTTVESWWPFPTAAPTPAELDTVLSAVDAAGVRLVGLNFFAGNMPAGERGVLSDPGRRDEFLDSLAVLTDVADRTGCAVFNAVYGQRRGESTPEEQDRCARRNLILAIAALPPSASVVLEALTVGESGDYPLATCQDVVSVIDRVFAETDRRNLGLLFDTYHLTNNGEDLPTAIGAHAALIKHVQFADSPGRGEPGSGRVDFTAVTDTLAAAGYAGLIAAEYRPRAGTVAGLGWVTG
ncbi:MAG TPA: TIM barrel protein [Pseudonocardiaceae bacterium]|jgi:hydroxypyruvate isomerase|nr:TIM barrel protein [Pseudonocardiaceae bacterium]